MDQSPLGSVLGHLAQMAERQGQLQQTQSEVLTELAQSLAADRAVLRNQTGEQRERSNAIPTRDCRSRSAERSSQ
ncbi:unnamed protein product [Boreogadus saida]